MGAKQEIKKLKQWIPINEKLPEIGGMYNIMQDLQDGDPPIVWTFNFDFETKKWFIDDSDQEEIGIVAWQELPEPDLNLWNLVKPKQTHVVPDPISLDEFERTTYGQCIHGENMANCTICNPELL